PGAAHLRPIRGASATIAFISSTVYCECCGLSPRDSTPPVAHTLMRSAPYLMFSRTLCCTAATPSAAPSLLAWYSEGSILLSQCPPGMLTGARVHNSRRPG